MNIYTNYNGGPHIESDQDSTTDTEAIQASRSNASTPRYDHNYNHTTMPSPGEQQTATMDARSIYVGQVDYGTSPEELQAFFQQCGMINRVTIICDKYTGHPKGYGFIEFAQEASANHALSFDQAFFRGRQLKVTPKRANVPGMVSRGRGRGRGRGYAPLFPPYYTGMPPPGYYSHP